MAKIVIITDQLSTTVQQVTHSLSELKNEVLLITGSTLQESQGNGANTNSTSAFEHIEIWSFFKTWSLLEGVRLLPRLLWLHPDTVHFFVHESPTKGVFNFLQKFFSNLPQCVVSTSFLTSKVFENDFSFVKKSLLYSDIITLPDLSSMQTLKGQELRPKQLRSLLPPLLDLHKQKKQKPMPAFFENQSREGSKPMLMYFSPELLQKQTWDKILPLSKLAPLLVWMDRDKYSLWNKKSLQDLIHEMKIQKNVQVLGLSKLEMQSLWPSFATETQALLLAHCKLSAEDLSFFVNTSFENSLPLVLDENQAAQYSSLFKSGKNVWVVRRPHWVQNLISNIEAGELDRSSPPSKTSLHEIQGQMLDQVINELNRIYNRAHHLKSMS